MNELCKCDKPGWCDVWQRQMSKRLHQLCNCTGNVTELQCVKYRKLFEQQLKEDNIAPTPRELIRNFYKAAKNHINTGRISISKVERNYRLDICRTNECGLYSQGRCKHKLCGCLLSVKSWWQDQECPIGKWPVIKKPEPGTVAVAMTTAHRNTPTIEATLNSVRLAGLPEPEIYEQSGGSFVNFCFALMNSVTNKPNCQLYLVLQDDLELTPNLWPWLIDNLPDTASNDFGVVSLYTAGPISDMFSVEGWDHIDPTYAHRLCFGALAYVFTRKSALNLIEYSANVGDRYLTDMKVGDWCRQKGLKYWMHKDSFVKHTGDMSSIRGKEAINVSRQCNRWVSSVDPYTVEQVDWRLQCIGHMV